MRTLVLLTEFQFIDGAASGGLVASGVPWAVSVLLCLADWTEILRSKTCMPDTSEMARSASSGSAMVAKP